MSYLAFTLLIIGLVCFITEIFIPGFGIFGITGIVSLIVSLILTTLFIPFGIFIVIGEIVFIVLFLYVLLKHIRKNQLKGKIILDETLNCEKKELGNLDYFLGKEGTAKTPLKPFGSADFNGITIDVYSDGEFIQLNEKVKVIDIKENKIYVRKSIKN